MDWVTIDFEASCLPRHGRSFPIEVGICGSLGTCSWLIKPAPAWRQWDWREEAFDLHGITRERLDEQGLDPAVVVTQLRRAVSGARVIADSTIDQLWWQTLLGAAEPASPAAPMVIEHINNIFDELGATPAQIEFAKRRADRFGLERHRAGNDAQWLFALLSALSERISGDREDAAHKLFPSWASENAYVRGVRQPQPVKG